MNKNRCLNFGKNYPSEFLYNNYYKLSVKAAPEPNTIYWENYGSSKIKLIIKMFFLICVLVGFVLITFVTSYVVKEASDKEFKAPVCDYKYIYAKFDTVASSYQ